MTTTTIWRFPLTITDEQSVDMPEGAHVLHADMQHGRLYLWAIVDPTMPRHPRTIRVYGTGHPMEDDPGRYIGMVDHRGTELHVFAVWRRAI